MSNSPCPDADDLIFHTDEIPAGGLVTVVTLWRPGWSLAQEKVLRWLLLENWPPCAQFIWTYSRGQGTLENLEKAKSEAQEIFSHTFDLLETTEPVPTTNLGKHQLIARLYSKVIESIFTEYVLFLEDDNVPPTGAWKSIAGRLRFNAEAAAIMGAYRSRQRCGSICAGKDAGYISWKATTQTDLIEADWVGGGFTIYRTALVRDCLPLEPSVTPRGVLGWDIVLCRKLREFGRRIYVDPTIRVEHLCPEVINYCNKLKINVA